MGVLAWQHDLAGVAKDAVSARVVPELVDGDKGVGDGGDAAYVAYEKLPKGPGSVARHDGHVSNERGLVELLIDALDLV